MADMALMTISFLFPVTNSYLLLIYIASIVPKKRCEYACQTTCWYDTYNYCRRRV